MKKGYVTFVNDNPNYLKLCETLIESVIQFTDQEIEVFSINFDYQHSSNRVISRRVELDRVGFDTICYSKIYSSLNTEFDIALQLDSDFILTKKIDKLFQNINYETTIPIFSLHPLDPNNQKNIMDILSVQQKTQKYVHATYLFSKNCNDFLNECFDFSQYCLKKNIIPQNFDETIFNVMLWKRNCVDKWIYPYDIWFETFLNPKNRLGYPENYELQFLSCHGCKDPILAKEIFEKISNGELEHLYI
jgi:hypothetical protein